MTGVNCPSQYLSFYNQTIKDHNHYCKSPFTGHSGNAGFVWNTLSLTNGDLDFCLLSCEMSFSFSILRTLDSDVGSPQKSEVGTLEDLVAVSSFCLLRFSTHNPLNIRPMAARQWQPRQRDFPYSCSNGKLLTAPTFCLPSPPPNFLGDHLLSPYYCLVVIHVQRQIHCSYFPATSESSFLLLTHQLFNFKTCFNWLHIVLVFR